MFSISNTLTLIAVAGNFLLGITVFLKGTRNKLNIAFAVFSLITVIWILTNYIFSFINSSFILHSQYALGSIILPVSLIWIYLLIDENVKRKNIIRLLIISACSFFIAYLDPLFISVVRVQSQNITVVPGPLFNVYSLFVIGVFILVVYTLVLGIKKTDKEKRIQTKFVLMGVILFAGISIMLDFVLPFFKIIPIGSYDAQSSLLFVTLSAYAIIKHKLFDLKIITTELITFALWIFILIRTLVADTMQDQIINGALLVVLVIFGLLLIKSVIHEVEQREKIEKLAIDLQKANNRLTELDKQKSEFVSFATHQLRAPLTAMKGYASLILDGDLGKLSKDLRAAIGRIFDSSNTLANIVDDYLNISRIELGTMKYLFDTIDLKDLVDSVIGELKPNIEKSHLAFSFVVDREKRYMVHADRDKFKQIIANVVDNSMKYTPTGSLTVSLEKKPQGKVLFSVKDTGIGIAKEVMPKLFAKFSRAENGNRQNIYGTGLGLYLAKEIVTAHSGRIWAESEGEGRGSTFFVELEEVV